MRIILSLTILLLALKSLMAQNLNIARHNKIDKVGNIVSINSKCYHFKEVGECCGTYASVIGIGDDGSSLFNTNLNYNDGFPAKIIRTADNHLLVYGMVKQACDVGGIKDFIAKVDTNGAIIFKQFIQSSWVFSTYIRDIAPAPDNSFYVVSDSTFEKYSNNGLLIFSTYPGLNNIKSIYALANGNVILHGKIGSATVNAEYDPINDVIVAQQNTTYSISKFEKVANGNIIALSGAGELISYDSGLNFLTNTSILTNSNVSISDFVTRHDSIFSTGTHIPSNSPFYGVLNSNFSLLNHSQVLYKGVRPSGIAITNKNKINILTNGSSSSFQNVTFTSLYQFPIYDGFSSFQDIGVVGVNAQNSAIRYASMYSSIADMEVVVKNFGVDSVKSFYLNNYFAGTFCPFRLHKPYQVTIPPGATVSIQTGTFIINAGFVPIPTPEPGTITKVKICVFTTVPNASNDIEIANDLFCDSVLYTITGIKENDFLAQIIKLYPNPANNGFTVKSDIEIRSIELINSLGERVKQESQTSKEFYVETKDLSGGVYFLRLKTDKGVLQKKLIKQ